MSKSLCEHILVFKPQKVANHFAKAGRSCTGNKKHSDSPLGICLTCGQVRCDSEQNQCTFQHHYGTKHPVIYRIQDGTLYCFNCKEEIGGLLSTAQESNKKDKVAELYEKIMRMTEKIGQKVDTEVVKTQTKAKKDKKNMMKEFHKTEEAFMLKKEQQQSMQKSNVKLDVFGLRNLGNTCFFNSIIQCLYACEQLHTQYNAFHFDTGRQFGRVGELILLFKKYLNNREKCFNPKSLFNWACKTKGQYKSFDQQDAQEFLALLVNGLIDGERFWTNTKPEYGRKLVLSEKMFGFFLASRLECLECSKVSWSVDFALEVAVHLTKSTTKSFPLPKGEVDPKQIKAEGLQYPPQKLSDTFLDTFFAPEALTAKNYFECEECEAGKAWRKFYIKDPPDTLIVSLKRFNNNLSKNNATVRPPYRLDIQGHCLNKGPLVYELFAISQHSGSSHGGHYVAYTRRGQQWYYFSDSSVKCQSWERVRASQPYILFYRRVE